jgi:hypothetical protein
VFLQCHEHHLKDGPEALRPVGETRWVDAIAAESRKGPAGAARVGGIVGTADLCLGEAVREVLEAHCAASELFRGIRDSAAWDDDAPVHRAARTGNAAMYADPAFRKGFAQLAPLGLSFDAYHYHPQNPHLLDLARAFPDTVIVLDHLGTPLGVGPYAAKREEVFETWSRDMAELATCPNVHVKLGGLAMPWNGFGFETDPRPPSSDRIVALQGRYYRHGCRPAVRRAFPCASARHPWCPWKCRRGRRRPPSSGSAAGSSAACRARCRAARQRSANR